ncbi:MAG: LysR substrate-binding domain-containing protein [Rhizobiaceae bacterium]
MARRLPPLNAIKSFEAAARHCSMTRAAQELGVSQVAVTRAVQLLENRIGSTLFSRQNKQLALTPAGEEYYRVVNDILDELSAATDRLTRSQDRHLRIWSLSLFNWWLFPRLRRFLVENPDIKVEITSSSRLENLQSSEFDAVIREGSSQMEGGPGVLSLPPIELTPVCAPEPHFRELRAVADLAGHTLLHSAYRPDGWAEWLAVAGCDTVDPQAGLFMDNSGYCFHAALEGVGVALGQVPLVKDALDRGKLIQPFPQVLVTDKRYYLVANMTRRTPALKKFIRWISSCD